VSSDGCSAPDLSPAAAPAPPPTPCGALGLIHFAMLTIGLAFPGYSPMSKRSR
jgi:hypothetical protein